MMAVIASSCAGPLLPFIQILLDIILLRKSPEHLPHSGIVLLMALLLWLFARLASVALIDTYDGQRFVVAVFSVTFACSVYAFTLMLAGKRARTLQTLTAVIGVSALLRVVYLAFNSLLIPFLGSGVRLIFVIAMVVWSIAVYGHIIARALDRHWYAGMAIALAVTIMQIVFESSIQAHQ